METQKKLRSEIKMPRSKTELVIKAQFLLNSLDKLGVKNTSTLENILGLDARRSADLENIFRM
jgi:hypothetical protein